MVSICSRAVVDTDEVIKPLLNDNCIHQSITVVHVLFYVFIRAQIILKCC